MASMQCQRTCYEKCETKCHDNSSFDHKLTDMASNVFKGLHSTGSTQAHCYGQTNGHHNGYGQTHQTQAQAQCYGQTNGYHNNGHGHGHGHGQGYGQTNGYNKNGYSQAQAQVQAQCYGETQHSHSKTNSSCHGQVGVGHNKYSTSSSCYEKKSMKKCDGEYKKKSCNTKPKDGNRSCSDSSSDSDSD